VDLDELKELIRIFEASQLAEVEIEEKGRRVRLKKTGPPPTYAAPAVASPIQGPASGAQAAPVAGQEDITLTTIKSPMVGTFYAAPAPDEAPFVYPGDAVDENQVVCIVEAMKLKNEVSAKFPAIIEKVLVQNGEPVEFGQPLFVVRPMV